MTDSTTSHGPKPASATKSRPDLFKRNLKIRQVRDSDLGFLWIAYEDGVFSDILMPGLGHLTFQQSITELIGSVSYDWIIEKDKPIGLVLGNSMAAGRGVEIQVDWMPWASTRDKIEGSAVFLREVQKQLKIFIFSSLENEHFFSRLCRYRMLRNGCKVLNHFGAGEDAIMFYSAGPH